MSIRFLKLSLASPDSIRSWTERVLPNGKRVGKILKGDLIDYKNGLPIRDGLSCERIFGPMVSFTCTCGRFKCIETRGIHIVHDALRSSRPILPDVSNSGLTTKPWDERESARAEPRYFQTSPNSTMLETQTGVHPIVSVNRISTAIQKPDGNKMFSKRLKSGQPIESSILEPIAYSQRKMIGFLSAHAEPRNFYDNNKSMYLSARAELHNKNETVPYFISILEERNTIRLTSKNSFKSQTLYQFFKKRPIFNQFNFFYWRVQNPTIKSISSETCSRGSFNKTKNKLKRRFLKVQNLLKPLYKFIFQIYTGFWFDLKMDYNNFIYEKHIFLWVSNRRFKTLKKSDPSKMDPSFFSKPAARPTIMRPLKIRGLFHKSPKLPILSLVGLKNKTRDASGFSDRKKRKAGVFSDQIKLWSKASLNSNFDRRPRFLMVSNFFARMVQNNALFLQKTIPFFFRCIKTPKFGDNWYDPTRLYLRGSACSKFKSSKYDSSKNFCGFPLGLLKRSRFNRKPNLSNLLEKPRSKQPRIVKKNRNLQSSAWTLFPKDKPKKLLKPVSIFDLKQLDSAHGENSTTNLLTSNYQSFSTKLTERRAPDSFYHESPEQSVSLLGSSLYQSPPIQKTSYPKHNASIVPLSSAESNNDLDASKPYGSSHTKQNIRVYKFKNFPPEEIRYCPYCEVELLPNSIRRYRLGYIEFVSPVTHIWYTANSIPLLLNLSKTMIEGIASCHEALSSGFPPVYKWSYNGECPTSWTFQMQPLKLPINSVPKIFPIESGKKSHSAEIIFGSHKIPAGADSSFKPSLKLWTPSFQILPNESIWENNFKIYEKRIKTQNTLKRKEKTSELKKKLVSNNSYFFSPQTFKNGSFNSFFKIPQVLSFPVLNGSKQESVPMVLRGSPHADKQTEYEKNNSVASYPPKNTNQKAPIYQYRVDSPYLFWKDISNQFKCLWMFQYQSDKYLRTRGRGPVNNRFMPISEKLLPILTNGFETNRDSVHGVFSQLSFNQSKQESSKPLFFTLGYWFNKDTLYSNHKWSKNHTHCATDPPVGKKLSRLARLRTRQYVNRWSTKNRSPLPFFRAELASSFLTSIPTRLNRNTFSKTGFISASPCAPIFNISNEIMREFSFFHDKIGAHGAALKKANSNYDLYTATEYEKKREWLKLEGFFEDTSSKTSPENSQRNSRIQSKDQEEDFSNQKHFKSKNEIARSHKRHTSLGSENNENDYQPFDNLSLPLVLPFLGKNPDNIEFKSTYSNYENFHIDPLKFIIDLFSTQHIWDGNNFDLNYNNDSHSLKTNHGSNLEVFAKKPENVSRRASNDIWNNALIASSDSITGSNYRYMPNLLGTLQSVHQKNNFMKGLKKFEWDFSGAYGAELVAPDKSSQKTDFWPSANLFSIISDNLFSKTAPFLPVNLNNLMFQDVSKPTGGRVPVLNGHLGKSVVKNIDCENLKNHSAATRRNNSLLLQEWYQHRIDNEFKSNDFNVTNYHKNEQISFRMLGRNAYYFKLEQMARLKTAFLKNLFYRNKFFKKAVFKNKFLVVSFISSSIFHSINQNNKTILKTYLSPKVNCNFMTRFLFGFHLNVTSFFTPTDIYLFRRVPDLFTHTGPRKSPACFLKTQNRFFSACAEPRQKYPFSNFKNSLWPLKSNSKTSYQKLNINNFDKTENALTNHDPQSPTPQRLITNSKHLAKCFSRRVQSPPNKRFQVSFLVNDQFVNDCDYYFLSSARAEPRYLKNTRSILHENGKNLNSLWHYEKKNLFQDNGVFKEQTPLLSNSKMTPKWLYMNSFRNLQNNWTPYFTWRFKKPKSTLVGRPVSIIYDLIISQSFSLTSSLKTKQIENKKLWFEALVVSRTKKNLNGQFLHDNQNGPILAKPLNGVRVVDRGSPKHGHRKNKCLAFVFDSLENSAGGAALLKFGTRPNKNENTFKAIVLLNVEKPYKHHFFKHIQSQTSSIISRRRKPWAKTKINSNKPYDHVSENFKHDNFFKTWSIISTTPHRSKKIVNDQSNQKILFSHETIKARQKFGSLALLSLDTTKIEFFGSLKIYAKRRFLRGSVRASVWHERSQATPVVSLQPKRWGGTQHLKNKIPSLCWCLRNPPRGGLKIFDALNQKSLYTHLINGAFPITGMNKFNSTDRREGIGDNHLIYTKPKQQKTRILAWKNLQSFRYVWSHAKKETFIKKRKQLCRSYAEPPRIVNYLSFNNSYNSKLSADRREGTGTKTRKLAKLIIEPEKIGNLNHLTMKRHKHILCYAYALETSQNQKLVLHPTITEARTERRKNFESESTYLNYLESLSFKMSCFSYFGSGPITGLNLGNKLMIQKKLTRQVSSVVLRDRQRLQDSPPDFIYGKVLKQYDAINRNINGTQNVDVAKPWGKTQPKIIQKIPKQIPLLGHFSQALLVDAQQSRKKQSVFNVKNTKNTSYIQSKYYLNVGLVHFENFQTGPSIFRWGKRGHIFGSHSIAPQAELNLSTGSYNYDSYQLFDPFKNPKQSNTKNTGTSSQELLTHTNFSSANRIMSEKSFSQKLTDSSSLINEKQKQGAWKGNTNYYACISQITSWGSDHGSWVLFLKYIRANIYKGDQLLPSYFNKMNFQIMPRTGSIMLQQLLNQLVLIPKALNQNYKPTLGKELSNSNHSFNGGTLTAPISTIPILPWKQDTKSGETMRWNSKQKSISEINTWQKSSTNTNKVVYQSMDKTDHDLLIREISDQCFHYNFSFFSHGRVAGQTLDMANSNKSVQTGSNKFLNNYKFWAAPHVSNQIFWPVGGRNIFDGLVFLKKNPPINEIARPLTARGILRERKKSRRAPGRAQMEFNNNLMKNSMSLLNHGLSHFSMVGFNRDSILKSTAWLIKKNSNLYMTNVLKLTTNKNRRSSYCMKKFFKPKTLKSNTHYTNKYALYAYKIKKPVAHKRFRQTYQLNLSKSVNNWYRLNNFFSYSQSTNYQIESKNQDFMIKEENSFHLSTNFSTHHILPNQKTPQGRISQSYLKEFMPYEIPLINNDVRILKLMYSLIVSFQFEFSPVIRADKQTKQSNHRFSACGAAGLFNPFFSPHLVSPPQRIVPKDTGIFSISTKVMDNYLTIPVERGEIYHIYSNQNNYLKHKSWHSKGDPLDLSNSAALHAPEKPLSNSQSTLNIYHNSLLQNSVWFRSYSLKLKDISRFSNTKPGLLQNNNRSSILLDYSEPESIIKQTDLCEFIGWDSNGCVPSLAKKQNNFNNGIFSSYSNQNDSTAQNFYFSNQKSSAKTRRIYNILISPHTPLGGEISSSKFLNFGFSTTPLDFLKSKSSHSTEKLSQNLLREGSSGAVKKRFQSLPFKTQKWSYAIPVKRLISDIELYNHYSDNFPFNETNNSSAARPILRWGKNKFTDRREGTGYKSKNSLKASVFSNGRRWRHAENIDPFTSLNNKNNVTPYAPVDAKFRSVLPINLETYQGQIQSETLFIKLKEIGNYNVLMKKKDTIFKTLIIKMTNSFHPLLSTTFGANPNEIQSTKTLTSPIFSLKTRNPSLFRRIQSRADHERPKKWNRRGSARADSIFEFYPKDCRLVKRKWELSSYGWAMPFFGWSTENVWPEQKHSRLNKYIMRPLNNSNFNGDQERPCNDLNKKKKKFQKNLQTESLSFRLFSRFKSKHFHKNTFYDGHLWSRKNINQKLLLSSYPNKSSLCIENKLPILRQKLSSVFSKKFEKIDESIFKDMPLTDHYNFSNHDVKVFVSQFNNKQKSLEFLKTWLFFDSVHGLHFHEFNDFQNQSPPAGRLKSNFSLVASKSGFNNLHKIEEYNFFQRSRSRAKILQFYEYRKSFLLKKIFKQRIGLTQYHVEEPLVLDHEPTTNFNLIQKNQSQQIARKAISNIRKLPDFFSDWRQFTYWKNNSMVDQSSLFNRRWLMVVFSQNHDFFKIWLDAYTLLKRNVNIFYNQEHNLNVKYELKSFGPKIKHGSNYSDWKNSAPFQRNTFKHQIFNLRSARVESFKNQTRFRLLTVSKIFDLNNHNNRLSIMRKNTIPTGGRGPVNFLGPLVYSSSIPPSITPPQINKIAGVLKIPENQPFWGTPMILGSDLKKSLRGRPAGGLKNFHDPVLNFNAASYATEFKSNENTTLEAANRNYITIFDEKLEDAPIYGETFLNPNRPLSSETLFREENLKVSSSYKALLQKAKILEDSPVTDPDPLDFKSICLKLLNGGLPSFIGWHLKDKALGDKLPLFRCDPFYRKTRPYFSSHKNTKINLINNLAPHTPRKSKSSTSQILKLASAKPSQQVWDAEQKIFKNFTANEFKQDRFSRIHPKTNQSFFSMRDQTKFENQTMTNLNDGTSLYVLGGNMQNHNKNRMVLPKKKSASFFKNQKISSINQNPSQATPVVSLQPKRWGGTHTPLGGEKKRKNISTSQIENSKTNRRTSNYGRNLRKLRLQYLRNFRRLRFIEYLKATYIKPEWMILSLLPVLPPDLRPVIANPRGYITGDINTHYQNVIYRNNNIEKLLDTFWIPRKFYSKTRFYNYQKASALMLSSRKSYFHAVNPLLIDQKALQDYQPVQTQANSKLFFKLAFFPVTFLYENEIQRITMPIKDDESLIAFSQISSPTGERKPINKSIKVLQNSVLKPTNNLFYKTQLPSTFSELENQNSSGPHGAALFLAQLQTSPSAVSSASAHVDHGFNSAKIINWKLERFISPIFSKFITPYVGIPSFNPLDRHLRNHTNTVDKSSDSFFPTRIGMHKSKCFQPWLSFHQAKGFCESKIQSPPIKDANNLQAKRCNETQSTAWRIKNNHKAIIINNEPVQQGFIKNKPTDIYLFRRARDFLSKTSPLFALSKPFSSVGFTSEGWSRELNQWDIIEDFQKYKKPTCFDLYESVPYKPLLKLDNHKSFFGSNIGIATGYNEIVQTIGFKKSYNESAVYKSDSITTKDDSVPTLETKLIRTQALHDSKPLQEMQYSLQKAVDALIDNSQKLQSNVLLRKGRPLKSLSDNLKGKEGRFRQHLLGKRVDYSGRSVIVVGPDLKLYECGIPLIMALRLFQPFLILYLIYRFKIASLLATQLIQRKHPMVINLLKKFIETWPILLNRAPTLHRMNIQAFKIRLVQGKAILLHPLVCSSYNADFDGDQMGVHVPITQQARAESWKLLWSINNSIAISSRQPLFLPSQDMVIGNYYLTAPPIDVIASPKRQWPFDLNGISHGQTRSFQDVNLNKKTKRRFSLPLDKSKDQINTFGDAYRHGRSRAEFNQKHKPSARFVPFEPPQNITLSRELYSCYPFDQDGSGHLKKINHYFFSLEEAYQYYLNTAYRFHINTPVWFRFCMVFETSEHVKPIEITIDQQGNTIYTTKYYEKQLKKNRILGKNAFYFSAAPCAPNLDSQITKTLSKRKAIKPLFENSLQKIDKAKVLSSQIIFSKNLRPILLNQLIRSTFGRIEFYYEAFNG